MSATLAKLKIAIVYDRLATEFGGAELVLQGLLSVFPEAHLWTSIYDSRRAKWVKNRTIHTTWLQRVPTAKRFYRSWVMAMPLAFESVNFDNYDIIISVTSGEAKGVLTKPHQLHLCYLLTPTRYLWSHRQTYQQSWTAGLRKLIFSYLQWWDGAAALRPDVIVPISKLVAKRCQTYYGRSTLPVIYPPVEINKIMHASNHSLKHLAPKYWLMVGRLVHYKGFSQAIEAAARLDQPLVIVGNGPDYSELAELAHRLRATVTFELTVQPDQLAAYYAGCEGFLAPGEEDFGITTLEALAAGKPVIVHQNSGAAECVTEHETGLFVSGVSVDELVETMQRCRKTIWRTKKIQQSAEMYDIFHFQTHFVRCLEAQWNLHQGGFLQKRST